MAGLRKKLRNKLEGWVERYECAYAKATLALDDAGVERDKRLDALSMRVCAQGVTRNRLEELAERLAELEERVEPGVCAHCSTCDDGITSLDDIIWVEKMPYCRRCSCREGLKVVCERLTKPHPIDTGCWHLEGAGCINPLPAAYEEQLCDARIAVEMHQKEVEGLVLGFCKWAGLPLECRGHVEDDSPIGEYWRHHEQNTIREKCDNSRPAEPLTLEVVLGALEAKDYLWELTRGGAQVWLRGGLGYPRVLNEGDILIALLRAAMAAVEGEKNA